MHRINDLGLTASNYKCFEDGAGFDQILPVNLIIGRNNSGKSSLLDLVEYAVRDGSTADFPSSVDVQISGPVDFAEVEQAFPSNTSMSGVGNLRSYGVKLIGGQLTTQITPSGTQLVSFDRSVDRQLSDYPNKLARHRGNPFAKYKFMRLSPGRDIVPEIAQGNVEVRPNGTNVTNVIQHFINDSHFPRNFVEDTLLEHLNRVVFPDAEFTRIVTQRVGGGDQWEIYLYEDGKGRIALRHIGTGVKTAILVLTMLILSPYVEGQRPLREFIFGFEELENNMHPAMFRRLLKYLIDRVMIDEFTLFLTTHSNVAIDMLATNEKAQILHVSHEKQRSTVKRVRTYIHSRHLLEDLDFRASDLLQANCVVWVEGPSDRTYIRRWIDLVSGEKLIEGLHYQCMHYGGALLAHLSADDIDESADAINILNINKNAILMADRDRGNATDSVDAKRTRISTEIMNIGGYAWITAGREVENYVPQSYIAAYWPTTQWSNPFTKFGDIKDYLEASEVGKGRWFERNKTVFAERIAPMFTLEDMAATYDLKDQVTEVCRRIASWNSIDIAFD